MPILALVFILFSGPSARAQDRREIVNRSGQPWTLALVEGTRPARGTLTLVDKFSGKSLATLAQVGDSATLPAQGRLLVVFNREAGYLYRHFILKDSHGFYAEYVSSVEFLTSRCVSIQLIDQHVGPPIDHSDDGTIKQFINDNLEIGSDNIIIHSNTLGISNQDGHALAIQPKFP